MSLPAPASDSTALITGASSGIGTAIARRLAALGYHLTLVARRRERLEELAEGLTDEHGGDVAVQTADLADPAERRELVEELRHQQRTVVGLVNSAGFGSYGRFDELDRETETSMVRLNVDAPHELCGAFVDDMVRRGGGAILNVGSIAGNQPTPGMATYAATKAFISTFSEALHVELQDTGVSCTVLMPGPVNTEFNQVSGAEPLEKAPDFLKVSSEEVARQAVDGMCRGRRTVVPGMATKAAALGGRFAPRSLLLPATMRTGGAKLKRSAPRDDED